MEGGGKRLPLLASSNKTRNQLPRFPFRYGEFFFYLEILDLAAEAKNKERRRKGGAHTFSCISLLKRPCIPCKEYRRGKSFLERKKEARKEEKRRE